VILNALPRNSKVVPGGNGGELVKFCWGELRTTNSSNFQVASRALTCTEPMGILASRITGASLSRGPPSGAAGRAQPQLILMSVINATPSEGTEHQLPGFCLIFTA
jgi:hypothetical protein